MLCTLDEVLMSLLLFITFPKSIWNRKILEQTLFLWFQLFCGYNLWYI